MNSRAAALPSPALSRPRRGRAAALHALPLARAGARDLSLFASTERIVRHLTAPRRYRGSNSSDRTRPRPALIESAARDAREVTPASVRGVARRSRRSVLPIPASTVEPRCCAVPLLSWLGRVMRPARPPPVVRCGGNTLGDAGTSYSPSARVFYVESASRKSVESAGSLSAPEQDHHAIPCF